METLFLKEVEELTGGGDRSTVALGHVLIKGTVGGSELVQVPVFQKTQIGWPLPCPGDPEGQRHRPEALQVWASTSRAAQGRASFARPCLPGHIGGGPGTTKSTISLHPLQSGAHDRTEGPSHTQGSSPRPVLRGGGLGSQQRTPKHRQSPEGGPCPVPWREAEAGEEDLRGGRSLLG